MKKILFLTAVLCITISSFAQYQALLKKNAKAVAPTTLKAANGFDLPVVGQHPINSHVSNKSILDDPVTAMTRYDLQTNSSVQRRCYFYPNDQVIGTTATWSQQDALWTDRGTGYNYFDGNFWDALPTARVESIRTGWPSYCPFGGDGELIISHQATGPLVMNTRTIKGTGAWTQSVLPTLPTTIPMMFWPRVVTNGPNHTYIHVIALTGPTANGGVVYKGMDGALVYSRSLDGGATWSDWIQPADLDSSNYTAFGGDTYSFAEPNGNTLAFTIGGGFYDQLLLKSTDNGTTWTKTVIHHSLYNLGGSSPTYFNAPDGTNAIALDNQGMAHVVFGLTYDSGTNTAWYYNILAQGIVYWNESKPQLRQDLDPDSLFASGNLVGWVQDTNVFSLPTSQITYWGASLTAFPALVIDKCNKLFLVFAGATTLIDPNNFNFRHLYGRRGYINGGNINWEADTLFDITGDWIQYNFFECMYPSVSPESDPYKIYILFQKDEYAGSYVKSTLATGAWQGQSSPDDNSIVVITWFRYFPCITDVDVKQQKITFSVDQNVPNPFDGFTEVNVNHQYAGDISLKVTNITGQTLTTQEKKNVLPGVSKFVIDGRGLSPGVYFYTVQQGNQKITKKMIVE